MESLIYDYCLLKLKKPVAREVYLDLMVNYDGMNDICGVFGHRLAPEDDPAESLFFEGRRFLVGACRQLKMLTYKTGRVLSGAALLSMDQMSVIGLHKCHLSSAGCKVARMISTEMVEILYEWAERMGAAPFKVCYYFKGHTRAASTCRELLEIQATHKYE